MKVISRICALLALAACATAAVPQRINYQGYLARPDGSSLDTTIAVTFRLYSDSSDVTPLWTEPFPVVNVESGLFVVRLGQHIPLTDDILNHPQVWLGVTVGGDTEMSPRHRIVSVGY